MAGWKDKLQGRAAASSLGLQRVNYVKGTKFHCVDEGREEVVAVAERMLQEAVACPRRRRELGTYSQRCPGTLLTSAPLEKANF